MSIVLIVPVVKIRCLIACASLSISAGAAWAAKPKARAEAHETYSAVDANPMEASASAISIPAPGVQAPGHVPTGATPPSHGSVVATDAAAPGGGRWRTIPFDSVPSGQADAISKRLRLVERLLTKYGRAYDYRTLTVKDLESILAYLEEEAERQSP
jgi:hypothetical protein